MVSNLPSDIVTKCYRVSVAFLIVKVSITSFVALDFPKQISPPKPVLQIFDFARDCIIILRKGRLASNSALRGDSS